MKQYLDTVRTILDTGTRKENRYDPHPAIPFKVAV